MTIAIVCLSLLAYILIATEYVTKVNKTTVAIFAGVVAWILYMSMSGNKEYIATHVFGRYAAYISNVVLYLLTTISIVDVLSTNGCFNFMTDLIRSRSTNRILWTLVGLTFLLSAHFDNLTTVVLMLGVMRHVLQNDYQRRYVASVVVIAACCGGSMTVIGDVTSLMVWSQGAVTPTDFSLSMMLPAIVGTVVPTLLIRRSLPDHLDLTRSRYGYRGDDSSMPLWQRIVMLVIGIAGLWFVPSFHRITLLPPFLGSLCVLAILWLVNGIFNRRSFMAESPMMIPGTKRRLHYEVYQMMMYFIGVALAVSVLKEIGVMKTCAHWLDTNIHDVYLISIFIGFVSAFLDNICLVLSTINIYNVLPPVAEPSLYHSLFQPNGMYWHLVIISGCLGGCLLPIGNVTGYALMKAEDTNLTWYVRHISGKVLLGWMAAMVTYFLMSFLVA